MTRANQAGGSEHERGATDDAAESPEGDGMLRVSANASNAASTNIAGLAACDA